VIESESFDEFNERTLSFSKLFLVSFGDGFDVEDSFDIKIFNNDESLEGSDVIHVDKKGEMI